MRHWTELPSAELGEIARAGAMAILPVAAVEQHGPHLPLGTDAFILEGVLDRVKMSGPREVLRLPLQTVGHSLEHTGYPGTLHADAETLLAKWTEIGRAVGRAGIRKLMILNSHGGQPQIVDLVALRLRQELGMFVTRVNTFALGVPDGLFDQDELSNGLHGGEVETSMMLALRP
ncbi:MAG: creatininase family protein, partial [Planctomycetota bacterium]